jgi:hypothetical protein
MFLSSEQLFSGAVLGQWHFSVFYSRGDMDEAVLRSLLSLFALDLPITDIRSRGRDIAELLHSVPRCQSFSRSYGFVSLTSPIYIVLSTRSFSPWRHAAFRN